MVSGPDYFSLPAAGAGAALTHPDGLSGSEWMAAAYNEREELANSLTHGVGALLSVAGLVLMVVFSARHGTAWHVGSTAIFGTTLIMLYTASTLYHSVRGDRLKVLLRKFDHAAIFLLIAGSYTPFALVTMRGTWGWTLFGVVWGLAVVGVTLKFRLAGRFPVVSTLIYIAMGWLVLVVIKPLAVVLPAGGMKLLVAGGLCYTGGAAFYLWKWLPYNHAIWHLWVIAGSACHWAAVFCYVVPDGP